MAAEYLVPEWWKGRHNGLKIRRGQPRAGSNPASGTRNNEACGPFFDLRLFPAKLIGKGRGNGVLLFSTGFARWTGAMLAGVLLLSAVLLPLAAWAGTASTAPGPPSFIPFKDLGGDRWAEPDVALLTVQGVVRGVSAASFAPNAPLTGEQAVCLLWRLLVPAGAASGGGPLPGVDSWAWAAADWAVKQGVVLHPGGFAAVATKPVPRQQVVAWVVRALGLSGGSRPAFKDADAVAAEYAPAVGTAQSDGLVNGEPDGNFAPLQPITRARMAVLLVNAERAAALADAGATPVFWHTVPGGLANPWEPGAAIRIPPLAGQVALGTAPLGKGDVEGGTVDLVYRTCSLHETFVQAGHFGSADLVETYNAAGKPLTGWLLWQATPGGGTVWGWQDTREPALPAVSYTQGADGVTTFRMAGTGSLAVGGTFQTVNRNGTAVITAFAGAGPGSGATDYLTGPVLPSGEVTVLEWQLAYYKLYSGFLALGS